VVWLNVSALSTTPTTKKKKKKKKRKRGPSIDPSRDRKDGVYKVGGKQRGVESEGFKEECCALLPAAQDRGF
jgi:hypothetical protein